MKKEALLTFDMTYLTQIALVLFFIAFLYFIWTTYSSKNKTKFEAISKIPLGEDNE